MIKNLRWGEKEEIMFLEKQNLNLLQLIMMEQVPPITLKQEKKMYSNLNHGKNNFEVEKLSCKMM